MASIQETLRAALGADQVLIDLVADRIYPGQLPDDEDPTPWLFYQLPESVPFDELDGDGSISADVEFHALADDYATAKAIIDAVFVVLDTYSGGQISRAFWRGTSEESTEEGYHHVARFTMWGSIASVFTESGSRAKILTGADSITLVAGEHTLTLSSDGLLLDGVDVRRLLTGNTLWVDAVNGDDGTATREHIDQPFATLAAAMAAAASGDTIHVRPGQQTDSLVLPAGKTLAFFFDPGASVHADHSDAVFSIFNAGSYRVYGFGQFTNDSGHVIDSNPDSDWDIECKSITQTGVNGITEAVAVDAAGDTSEKIIRGAIISAPLADLAAVRVGSGLLTLERCTIVAPDAAPAVISNGGLTLRNCRIEGLPFYGGDTVRVEGVLTLTELPDPTVIITGGLVVIEGVSRPDVTGSRGGNAALTSLLSQLAALGLITNSTT